MLIESACQRLLTFVLPQQEYRRNLNCPIFLGARSFHYMVLAHLQYIPLIQCSSLLRVHCFDRFFGLKLDFLSSDLAFANSAYVGIVVCRFVSILLPTSLLTSLCRFLSILVPHSEQNLNASSTLVQKRYKTLFKIQICLQFTPCFPLARSHFTNDFFRAENLKCRKMLRQKS